MPANAPIEAVLFTLMGQGDKDLFLAPVSALDWCESVKPGMRTLPEDVKRDLIPFRSDFADEVEEDGDNLHVTTGSADNDAALFLSCRCRSFDSTKDALNYIQEQGWILSDREYDGCIY